MPAKGQVKNYAHGTTSKYYQGCRCGECKQAKSIQGKAYRTRKLAALTDHGTHSAYIVGCRCVSCCDAESTYMCQWRLDHRDQNLWSKAKTYHTKAAIIDNIKLETGCADCGYNAHPAALQFDHVLGVKLFSISDNKNRYSMERILAEIEKCDVVCGNCHAIRTVERRQHVSRGEARR